MDPRVLPRLFIGRPWGVPRFGVDGASVASVEKLLWRYLDPPLRLGFGFWRHGIPRFDRCVHQVCGVSFPRILAMHGDSIPVWRLE